MGNYENHIFSPRQCGIEVSRDAGEIDGNVKNQRSAKQIGSGVSIRKQTTSVYGRNRKDNLCDWCTSRRQGG